MIKNVTLKYSNDRIVQVERLCSYRIHSIQKEFLLYTEEESFSDFKEVYFGELVKENGFFAMKKLQDSDVEAFTKFLIALSQTKLEEQEYSSTTNELENQSVVIQAGGKTKLKPNVVELYFTKITKEIEPEEIEELFLDDIEEYKTPQEEVESILSSQELMKEETDFSASESSSLELANQLEMEKQEGPELTEQKETFPIEELNQLSKKKKKGKTLSYFVFVAVLVFALLLIVYMSISSSKNGFEGNWKFLNNHSTISLEQIGQKLKTSSFLTDMVETYGDIFITTTSSELSIKLGEENELEYRYVLKGDNLYTTFAKDDEIGMRIAEYTYTYVQELLGNDRNEVFNRVTVGFENPSLKKEGILILEDGLNKNVQISMKTKIDVSSIVLEGPIEKELFQSYQDELLSNKQLTLQYGKISFIKYAKGDKIQILLVEKDRLSKHLYQTLLNYLSVAYGETKMLEFQNEYGNFIEEKKEFQNYTISVNEALDGDYSNRYSSREYEWVVIEIENKG